MVSALGIEEQRVEVRLSLVGIPPARLGHGFRVVARISLHEAKGILRVPISALFRERGDWAVFVVEDGRAILRTITIGHRNEDVAEVIEGLEAGATVVLHPADDIVDGVRVTQ